MSRLFSRTAPNRLKVSARSGLMLGTATLAIALSSAPARAECTPQGNGVACLGVTDGYTSAIFDQTVTVAPGARINADAGSGNSLTFAEAGNLVVNGAVVSTAGIGVDLSGTGSYRLQIGEAGSISGITAIATPTDGEFRQVEIDNRGVIEGTGGTAVSLADAEVDLVNRGTIRGAVAFSGDFNERRIENRGRIEGDANFAGESGDEFYQRIGASITGGVSLGDGNDAYWREQRGDTLAGGVGGSVDAGAGDDVYGIRLTASGTITLDPTLPAGFERYGVDLCGCDVDGIIAAGSYSAPLLASGEGRLVSNANFTYTGAGPVLDIVSESDEDTDGDFGLQFVNNGTITATGTDSDQSMVRVGVDGDALASLTNEGTINLDGEYAYGIDVNGIPGFVDGVFPASFTNRGTVNSRSSTQGAVVVRVAGSMVNSGTVNAEGDDAAAVELDPFSTLRNEAGGTIRSTGQAVTLATGGSINNSGLIESTTAPAVSISGFGSTPATVINEAGGTIRGGNGVAISRSSGAVGANIANKGRIEGDIRLNGNGGNDVIWLTEGSVVDGDIETGYGSDTLVLDVSRLNPADGSVDTTGVLTGNYSAGSSSDTLWARAGADTAVNVVEGAPTGFNGVVYEAAGTDTELTLRGPLDTAGNADTFDGTLRVAGDGTVIVDMGINNGGTSTQSLVVEADSTAGWFGEGAAAGPALVLADTINAGFADINVDATEARSVTFRQNAGDVSFTGGVGLATGPGTQVLLEGGSRIRNVGSSTAFNAVGIEAFFSDIVNRGNIIEDSDSNATAANVSKGVVMTGGSLRNERTNNGVGRITTNGTAVEVEGDGLIVNSGDITSQFGDAIQVVGTGSTRIVNETGGIISGHVAGNVVGTAGAAIDGGFGNETVENAGTINGNVVLGAGDDAYIATGGRLNGSLDLGTGNDVFLTRNGAAADVTGTVAGGTGYDAYGRSFSETGTFDLAGNVLPADFEAHGVEALGENTIVTITSAATQTAGLKAFGDGTVINTANFDFTAPTGAIGAVEISEFTPGEGSLAFDNRGTINSNVIGVYSDGGLQSFTNSGTIAATDSAVSARYDGAGAFTFRNSGGLSSTGGSNAVELFVDGAGENLDFANSGQITQSGGDGAALFVDAETGLARIGNAGTIASSSIGGTGAFIRADLFALNNTGTIEASGRNGTALAISTRGEGIAPGTSEEDCPPGQEPGGSARVVADVTNSGTIRANGGGADDGETGQFVASAVAVNIEGDYGIARLTNAAGGLIEATGGASSAILVTGETSGYGGTDVDAALRLFELENSGTIRGGADTAIAAGNGVSGGGDTDLDPIGDNGTERTVAGGIQTVNTTDRIRNLAGGQIIGNVDLGSGDDVFENYGTLTGDLRLGSGSDTFVFAASSTFTGTAFGGEGTDTLLVDLNGEGSVNFDQFRGFETLSQRGSGTVAIRGTTDLDTLNIAGSQVRVTAGTRFDTQGDLALQGSDAVETLTVAGTIGGSVDMGGGADIVTLSAGGLIEGDLDLGAGDDRLVLGGGTVTGVVDGGNGTDTVAFQITQDTSGLPNVVNFESLDVDGNARLTIAANQDFDTITLRNGADLTLDPGTGGTIGNIVGDDSANDVVINTQLTGGVSLGGGDDTLSLILAGSLSGALDGGAGNDTLNLNLTAASSIDGGINSFETINVAGSSPLTLGATIAAGQALNFDGSDNELIIDGGSILGSANGGAGRDRLTFNNAGGETNTLTAANVQSFEDIVGNGSGTLVISGDASYQTIAINGGNLTIANESDVISGQTTFDAADNVLTLGANATLAGPVDGGDGTDRLVLNQAANQVRLLGSLNYSGFEELESGGPGELRIDSNAAFDVVDLLGARMTVDAGATLTVPTLAGGDGANTLEVRGTLAGNVDLGAGDDRLILARLDSVTGTRTGGEGSDTLEFRTESTYEAPTSWDGTGFTSFENLAVSQGVLSLTGDTNWTNVAVTGGRLIGQAGTTITAGTIDVARGATFGSAGTVNANINVSGTLSPGASPGTMTVNGNVSFASGSNLLLELTPTGRDLLDISGTLTIAQGAAIDITGALSAVPGGAIDLVVADGGITGGFSTINKSSTVFGFVATRGNRIQIVGEFSNNAAFGTNVQASVDYANDVLSSGRKVQDFTTALSTLVDATGATNAAAFAQLTPEAYGSASELAIDTGLTIVDTARNLRMQAPSRPGFYGFAQGLQQWSRLDGSSVTGAADSRSNSTGLMGGIGYATESLNVGAFIGSIDSDQRLAALGASTEANGVIAGVFADAQLGGFGLHALVAYDGSEATTRRDLPTGQDIQSDYDLGGWIADFSVDYRFDLGGLQLTPRAGLSYVAARREGVVESGNAFALAVDGDRANAWFGDAGIELGYETRLGGLGFRPYAEIGVRHQLSERGNLASATFADTPTIGPITVSGVERDRTVARIGAGFGLDLSDRVRLNVNYGGEIADTTRHNLTGGLTIAF